MIICIFIDLNKTYRKKVHCCLEQRNISSEGKLSASGYKCRLGVPPFQYYKATDLSLALTVWERQCVEDIFTKDDLVIY